MNNHMMVQKVKNMSSLSKFKPSKQWYNKNIILQIVEASETAKCRILFVLTNGELGTKKYIQNLVNIFNSFDNF